MRRDQATMLVAEMLERVVASGTWQLEAVQAVYLFGSYARGSLEPGDVDVAVDIDRGSPEWRSHFLSSFSYGRDPYAALRVALSGRRRAISLVFDREQYSHIEMLRIWRRGESFDVAMLRVRAIATDLSATRAPREAMLAAFDGVEEWVPLYIRQELVTLVGAGTVQVDRITLDEGEPTDRWVRAVLNERWTSTSPLRRSAAAVLYHWEKRSVDLSEVYLHGKDLDPSGRDTPYCAGLGMRYFDIARRCFTEYGCVEWIEVVRPTRRGAMQALVLQRGKTFESTGWPWRPDSSFR